MDVGVTEFRRDLKEWLSRVSAGEEIVITERGKPIARVSPVGLEERLARLVREGILTPPLKPDTKVASRPRVRPRESVSELLIQMRG